MAVGLDDPVVVRPGEGELVFDDESGSSRIKIARDELLLSETTLKSGAPGVKPHIHREHADAFYVLEGALDFHVAGEQRTVEAGGLVLAPPGLVHGFQVGPNGDRHLNIHTPGAAFARLSRARRDGVPINAGAEGDTFPPPDGGGRPATEAVLHRAGEGERLGTTMLKAALPQISLLEFEIRPGGGVSPHFHKAHSDSFYVLEGELQIHLGDGVVTAVPGTYAFAPPEVVHWFRNVGEAPTRVLNLHTPGGFAEYRRELERLRSQGIEPDREFFERHDLFDV
jgi:quercetin dioxygenase-like cupin family protein